MCIPPLFLCITVLGALFGALSPLGGGVLLPLPQDQGVPDQLEEEGDICSPE